MPRSVLVRIFTRVESGAILDTTDQMLLVLDLARNLSEFVVLSLEVIPVNSKFLKPGFFARKFFSFSSWGLVTEAEYPAKPGSLKKLSFRAVVAVLLESVTLPFEPELAGGKQYCD